MAEPIASGPPGRGTFETSWRNIALWSIGAAIVGIAGSLGALVLVATANDADALSTIALALAVIAFVIQILVFIAQVFASSQQTTRSEETYARLNGLLEGLKGTTQGTQETLSRYMGALLKAATGVATEALEEEGSGGDRVSPEELERRIAERAREVVPPGGAFPWPYVGVGPTSSASPEDREIIAFLTTPAPEEEGRKSYEILKSLSPLAVSTLEDFVKNEIQARRSGRAVGISKSPTATWSKELQDKGLVEPASDSDQGGSRRMVLTPAGRRVGRLLSGLPFPAWLRRAAEGESPPGGQA